MNKIEMDKKTLATVLAIILAVSSIVVTMLSNRGIVTPEEATMIRQLMQDLNLTWNQVYDALQLEVGSTLYGLASDYSYMISHPLGDTSITAMKNGTTGAWQWWSTNTTSVEVNVVGNNTDIPVFCKSVAWNFSVASVTNLIIVEANGGLYRTFTSYQAGESITSGQATFLNVTDGKLWLADADSNTTMGGGRILLATQTVSVGGYCLTLSEGQWTNSGWSWDIDNPYIYVSATAGSLTQTYPSSSGQQVELVATVVNATTVYFKPTGTVYEIA